MAEAIISLVVENICNLLKENPQILSQVSDQVEQIVDKFRRIRPFLKDAESRQEKEERIRLWIADLRKLVYDADDVIEGFVVKASSSTKKGGTFLCALDGGCLHRHNILRDLEAIQKRIQQLTTSRQEYNITSIADSSSNYEMPGKLQRFFSHVVVEPQVVGLQDDVNKLVAYLMDESEDSYRVVSICGMGGLGKTTLAEQIYNHSAIKAHFDGLAWVSVSEHLQLRNVLQRIINCLVKDEQRRGEIKKLDDVELLELLRNIQSTTKCLVVVDDIWTNEDWDRLKAAFPTPCLRSKLLLTSRDVQLSHHVDPRAFLHRPQLLDEEQSWDLLKMKALPHAIHLDASDVEKREELGRKMVGHCGGLPLAIVVLGGILVTKQTWMAWEFVHQGIQSSIKSGKGMGKVHQKQVVREILALSYNNLPYQLKPCFLYLGRFGEDVKIKAEKLYQLWIAEGFVLSSDRRNDGETLMEVAESYMAELVHKCMVEVKIEEHESSLRKFRSFVLHDFMRELALLKAKEEDFFNVLDLRQDNGRNHNNNLHVVKPTYTRRLDFYSDGRDVISSKDIRLVKEVSSILWFSEFKLQDKISSPLIFRLNFRFLRVLSFEGFDCVSVLDFFRPMLCDNMCVGIACIGLRIFIRVTMMTNKLSKILGSLVNLRYLSLRRTNLLPFASCMEKLEQLQTLDLRVWLSGIELWRHHWKKDVLQKMGQLRHLYLPKTSEDKEMGSSNNKLRLEGLSELETLENFYSDWCQVQDLHKLNNLRKLKMRTKGDNNLEETMQYLESKASSCLRYISFRIDFENNMGSAPCRWKRVLGSDGFKLNELKIWQNVGELSLAPDIHNHVAASCLTHLEIHLSLWQGDPMPVQEKLPALRYLHLDRAFQSKEMACSNMGFLQLKLLKLYGLDNLEKWKVEQGSMPNLEKLEIRWCNKLEEIPEGLKFIDSLQLLQIHFMPKQFCERIRGPDFYKVSHVPSLVIVE